jgi:hypothetical protein
VEVGKHAVLSGRPELNRSDLIQFAELNSAAVVGRRLHFGHVPRCRLGDEHLSDGVVAVDRRLVVVVELGVRCHDQHPAGNREQAAPNRRALE